MSVFKLQEWWSVKVGDEEEFDQGCMIVGNIDNANPATDKIAVGSFQGMFRMYQPTKPQFRVEDLVLEESLGLPILQLLVGKFIPGTDILGVAVLHPKKLVVYEIIPQGVKDNRATYYIMRKAYQHDLGVEGKHFTAYNMTSGSFGGVRGRDMFVVQSMDGKLMILEQSAHAFSRQLSDCLIPGPIVYLPKVDAFVTVNYACTAECYRYQVLASSQDSEGSNLRHGDSKEDSKNNERKGLASIRSAMMEWSLKIGEMSRQIVEGNFTSVEGGKSNSTELLVVCDKSLFLLKGESGGLIQQKRLERSDASCVCAYPTGSAAAPMNFILAGQDGTIQIYSAFNLVWAAKANTVPIQMAVSSFGGQQGLIVTLDDAGGLAVSFLGTKPPINSVVTHVRDINYDKIDEEHRALLQIIRDSQSEGKIEPVERLVIRSQLAKTLDSEFAGMDVDLPRESLVPVYSPLGHNNNSSGNDNNFVKICVRVYLSYSGSQPATDVSVVVSTPSSVHAVPKNILLQKVSGSKSTPLMVKVFFYVLKSTLPSGLEATVTATYTSSKGEPRVTSHNIALPLFLACRLKAPVKSALCKIILDTEQHPAQTLTDLFDDLLFASQASGLEVSEVLGNSATTAMGFQLFAPVYSSSRTASTPDKLMSSVASILVSKNAGRYRLQADSWPALCLITNELERRLNARLAPSGNAPGQEVSSSVSVVKCADPIPLEDYFAVIQSHFDTRLKINELSAALDGHATQYRLVQKRLLVRFKDKNPTPLGGLDFLLTETYNKIIAVADSIEQQQVKLRQQASEIDCFSKLIANMAAMKFGMSGADRALFQSFLCPEIKDGAEQGWEETVNGAVMYLLKTSLAKNVKESASLTGTTLEIATTIEPLKKHLSLVMDRLEKGGKISLPSSAAPSPVNANNTANTTTNSGSQSDKAQRK